MVHGPYLSPLLLVGDRQELDAGLLPDAEQGLVLAVSQLEQLGGVPRLPEDGVGAAIIIIIIVIVIITIIVIVIIIIIIIVIIIITCVRTTGPGSWHRPARHTGLRSCL